MRKELLLSSLFLAITLSGCLRDPFAGHGVSSEAASEVLMTESIVLEEITEAIPVALAEPEETAAKATLLFGGDIMFSNHVLTAYDQAGGVAGVLDNGYREAISAADLFIANEEFPFSRRGQAAADKQYTFCLPPERVAILTEMEVDIVSLANNHALDFGREALTDTLMTLDEAQIAHIGAGENLAAAKAPVITTVNGIKVGILGATRVIPVAEWAASDQSSGMLATYDPTVLLAEIAALRPQCDYVIVYVHWGIERAEWPEEYQRVLGQQYLDAGADLVIGSHPHVLQGIELYDGKPIVYSLGNFVFGSSIPKTALLQLELERQEGQMESRLKLVPGTSANGYTQTLTDQDAINRFYHDFEQLSPGITFSGEELIRELIVLE